MFGDPLSAVWQSFFYGIGVVVFGYTAVVSGMKKAYEIAGLGAGLAVVTFISFWNALAAA